MKTLGDNPIPGLPGPLRRKAVALARNASLSMSDIRSAIESASLQCGTDWLSFTETVTEAVAWILACQRAAESVSPINRVPIWIDPKSFMVVPFNRLSRKDLPKYWHGGDDLTLRDGIKSGTGGIKTWAHQVVTAWWSRQARIAGVSTFVVSAYYSGHGDPWSNGPWVYHNKTVVEVRNVPPQGLLYDGEVNMTWGAISRLQAFGVRARPGILPIEVLLSSKGNPEAIVALVVEKDSKRVSYMLKRLPFPLSDRGDIQ